MAVSLNPVPECFYQRKPVPKSLPPNASPIKTFGDKSIGGLNRGGGSGVVA